MVEQLEMICPRQAEINLTPSSRLQDPGGACIAWATVVRSAPSYGLALLRPHAKVNPRTPLAGTLRKHVFSQESYFSAGEKEFAATNNFSTFQEADPTLKSNFSTLLEAGPTFEK